MRRVKLEQTRALRRAMERRQERRRLILRLFALFALLMLLIAFATFLVGRIHPFPRSAPTTVLLALSTFPAKRRS